MINIQNLSYTYSDSKRGIKDISLSIKSKESIALVGENGSGKSTLLLHFNGILKAHQGSIQIQDTIIEDTTLIQIRRKVGMIFQNSDDQLFMPTVFDDVAFGLSNLGVPQNEIHLKVENALNRVGMLHLKGRPPYKLSTGEKKPWPLQQYLS